MYCVVVQNDYLVVEKVISCDTMAEVQAVLEALEPDMDSEYLVVGEASNLTYGLKTYSFRKLENAESFAY